MTHLNSHTEPPKFALIDFRRTQTCGSPCTQHLRPANSAQFGIDLRANKELKSAPWEIALRRDLQHNALEIGKQRTVSDLACERMHGSLVRQLKSSQLLCATPADRHKHLIRTMNQVEIALKFARATKDVSCLSPHRHTGPAINAHTRVNHASLSAPVGIDRHRLSPVPWNRCAKISHICASP